MDDQPRREEPRRSNISEDEAALLRRFRQLTANQQAEILCEAEMLDRRARGTSENER